MTTINKSIYSSFNNALKFNKGQAPAVQNNSQNKKQASDSVQNSSGAQNNKDTVEINGRRLTRKQLAILLELKKRDQQVRQHEMAHLIAGGQYVRGGPNYVYEVGPDGRRYAVGGDASIDTSPERDPRATLRKMLTVERAALAPANPSAQDRAVAAKAAQEASKAEMEIIEMQQRSHQNSLSHASSIKNNEGSQVFVQNSPSTTSSYSSNSNSNNSNIGNFLNIFI